MKNEKCRSVEKTLKRVIKRKPSHGINTLLYGNKQICVRTAHIFYTPSCFLLINFVSLVVSILSDIDGHLA